MVIRPSSSEDGMHGRMQPIEIGVAIMPRRKASELNQMIFSLSLTHEIALA